MSFPAILGALPIRRACLLLLAVVALAGTPAGRVAAGSLEYRVKAACLCNFLKFMDWPAETFAGPGAPYVICVLGADPFGSDLDTAAASAVVGRPLVVRRIGDVKAARQCHIVFVSDAERPRLTAILGALADSPVLTVGDDPQFTAMGGGLRFFLAENRVRFEINLPVLDRARLKPSANLLSLARVIGKPRGGH
jgi:hypothetical protein